MEFSRFDVAYMKMARTWGNNSHAIRKKVGAFIVKDNAIISDGFNGTPKGFENDCEDENGETKWEVIHAEANAIGKIAQSTNSSKGATLYCTLSPCRECAKLILASGISKAIYDRQHSNTDGIKLLKYGGVTVEQLELTEDED